MIYLLTYFTYLNFRLLFSYRIFILYVLEKKPKDYGKYPFMGNMYIFIYVVMVQSSDYSHI